MDSKWSQQGDGDGNGDEDHDDDRQHDHYDGQINDYISRVSCQKGPTRHAYVLCR